MNKSILSQKNVSRKSLGIVFMIASVTVIPITDALAKLLGQHYAVPQIVWARYSFTSLLMLPIVLHQHGFRALVPCSPLLEIARALTMVITNIAYFAAIQYLPLANALGIFFIYPLITTLAASKFLGEPTKVNHFIVCSIGFLGALIIIRPGFTSNNIGILYALLSSLSISLNLLLNRKLSSKTPASVGLLYTTTLGWLIMSLFMRFFWKTPNIHGWLLFFSMSLAAAIGNWLLYAAFKYAPAVTLAPFSYSEIVTAAAFGYLLFGDIPDLVTIFGIVLIIASGIYTICIRAI